MVLVIAFVRTNINQSISERVIVYYSRLCVFLFSLPGYSAKTRLPTCRCCYYLCVGCGAPPCQCLCSDIPVRCLSTAAARHRLV